MPQTIRNTALLAAALAVSAACSDVPSATSHVNAHVNAQVNAYPTAGTAAVASPGLVKQVHAATARFHSLEQAEKFGYEVASPCVSHPTLGAMGYHYVNESIVDPVFDPMAPEALVYAPTANGRLKLVAAEYIVIDVGQPAPTFEGQPFDVGGTPVPVPHWSLHVWAHRDNPAGIFTPFNPAVTCTP